MDWLDHKIPCDRRGGDHPWEIKRGGNTTHIDLYVSRVRDCGWYANEEERKKAVESRKVEVGLRGQHIGRIVETVKMFLALHHAGLPIWICDAESVRNRILGLDHFGIMPDSESLHRGWQSFPADFHIEDVMHLRSFGRARSRRTPVYFMEAASGSYAEMTCNTGQEEPARNMARHLCRALVFWYNMRHSGENGNAETNGKERLDADGGERQRRRERLV